MLIRRIFNTSTLRNYSTLTNMDTLANIDTIDTIDMIDIMGGKTNRINIDTHGFIQLVDVMPRLVPMNKTADYAIAEAARVSYANYGGKKTSEDIGLIRRLMRDKHTSPFEMIEFKFLCSLPIFVARQWIRHRTA